MDIILGLFYANKRMWGAPNENGEYPALIPKTAAYFHATEEKYCPIRTRLLEAIKMFFGEINPIV